MDTISYNRANVQKRNINAEFALLCHDNVKVEFELDREMAIEKAIKMSTNNDIVVLAGKGEDPYQKIKGVDVPYPSDVNVAKKIVEEL